MKIIKTPKVSNSNFYLRLIQMVQQNPCFYNTCDPNYRKYFYKCQIWNKIAKDLEYDGDNHGIYKQWKKLRDRYVRENRKLRLTGRSKSTCKWEFFNYMEWMEPFIEDSKPLEDYEIPLKRGESDSEEMTKSIYENGKKKAQIKFLKPANKILQMPKLEPQIDQNKSYTEYPESNHPIIVYANPDESHTSTIIVTTSGESDSIIQPEITYYIEGSDDEQYILDSDALQYELHEDDIEGGDEQQEYDVDEEIESDEIGFPEEVLLSCQEDSEGPSSSNVIYAVNKHTDLNTLPENIRFAIEAQGKDVFKDKSILYVK
uniref:MADF domain-containing protein n=1 Tax=Panagrolaimus davidi TaxID=227884 RepID=A0A914Q218_9BILA